MRDEVRSISLDALQPPSETRSPRSASAIGELAPGPGAALTGRTLATRLEPGRRVDQTVHHAAGVAIERSPKVAYPGVVRRCEAVVTPQRPRDQFGRLYEPARPGIGEKRHIRKMGKLTHASRYFAPVLRGALNVSFDGPLVVDHQSRLPRSEFAAAPCQHLVELMLNLFVCSSVAVAGHPFRDGPEQDDRKLWIKRPVSPQGEVRFAENLHA